MESINKIKKGKRLYSLSLALHSLLDAIVGITTLGLYVGGFADKKAISEFSKEQNNKH